MKLTLITDQGGDFDKYYAHCTSPTMHPSLLPAIEKVRNLFRYLEEHVEGPDQWVTISHLVRFHMSDNDDWRPEKAQVFVCPREEGFEIKYRSSRRLHYWDAFTTLTAHDLAEAGEMIVEALQRAERNLPGRGELGFKATCAGEDRRGDDERGLL